mgnify:CR=1 FL=1
MVVDEKQLTEDILRLAATDVSRCMQCGRCSANCEAASKMDTAAAFVAHAINNRLCTKRFNKCFHNSWTLYVIEG